MKLRDIKVGDSFVFKGETFTKINNFGEAYGICNCKDKLGNQVHFHPSADVECVCIQEKKHEMPKLPH